MGIVVESALLEQALAGVGDAVVAELTSLTESQRRSLAKQITAASKDHGVPHYRCAVCDALSLAEFGVLPPSRIRRLTLGPERWRQTTSDPRYEAILRLRPRPWRQSFLNRANWRLGFPWLFAYRVVCDGLADPPDSSWYIAAAVRGPAIWGNDRKWLENEFWRFFTCQEAADDLSHDYRVGGAQGWELLPDFRELADSGRVPRDRLLDACLDALRRDFPPRATHFYRALFSELRPTPQELRVRQTPLRALLSADDRLDVGFALRYLSELQSEGLLAEVELLDALGPAIASRMKKNALGAIAIAENVLQANPGLSRVAVPALIEGLLHERSDVQRAAFKAMEPYQDDIEPADMAVLKASAEDLDPAIVAAIPGLAESSPHSSAARVAAAPATTLPREPELSDADRLVPIASAAEFAERARRFSDYPCSADELELLLDAIARFPDAAAQMDPALFNRGLRSVLGRVLRDMALRRTVRRFYGLQIPQTLDPSEMVMMRVRELGDVGYPREPLSTPTRRGGWIEPREAVRRLANLKGAPFPWDLAQLVLRIWRDDSQSLLTSIETLDSEAAAIVAYSLGAEVPPRPHQPALEPAWAAARAIRDPKAHEAMARTRAAGMLEAAKRFHFTMPHNELPPLPSDPIEAIEGTWMPSIDTLLWLSTAWPGNHEPIFRKLTHILWRAWPNADVSFLAPVIALLADERTPAGPDGALAAAMCLGSATLTLRACAAEATAQAMAAGKVTGSSLGGGLGKALREHRDVFIGLPDNKPLAAVPQRWVTPLADIARTSPHAAHEVQTSLEAVLASAEAPDRRRLSAVVDLLRQLAIRSGRPLTDPAARAFLDGYSGRSQGGRVAREILAISGTRDR